MATFFVKIIEKDRSGCYIIKLVMANTYMSSRGWAKGDDVKLKGANNGK